jgi:hypothetical protein
MLARRKPTTAQIIRNVALRLKWLGDRRAAAVWLLVILLPTLGLGSCEGGTTKPIPTPLISKSATVLSTPTKGADATMAASATVQASATAIPSSPPAAQRLIDTQAGYSLSYPSDWQLQGQVLSTEFAAGAQCQSVEIIDYEPAGESGPAPGILHSFVQVCAQSLGDGLTLDAFMRQTYGQSLGSFERVEVSGIPAYQTSAQPLERMIFLQTQSHRLQIAAAVVAAPERRAERQGQMEAILESFSIIAR